MAAPLTVHYHGTPVTPLTALYELAGRNLCVSHATGKSIVERVAGIAQLMMLDNGAFSKFKSGTQTDWEGYYLWVEPYLSPTCWAVVPDVIDAGSQEQDALIREWPHGKINAAPVWHMDEPLPRLLRLLDEWPRVCIGSTGEFWKVQSVQWEARMDESFEAVVKRHKRPNLHMLRGLDCCGKRWPFASADSTNIAQNHHLAHKTPKRMADEIDAVQCPRDYIPRPTQIELSMHTRKAAE